MDLSSSKINGRDSSSTAMMMMIRNKSSSTTTKSTTLRSYEEIEQEESFLINNAFSWPPRSYTCSFCKREFRSAQALGGHMNVHRKDRARLRQSPPRYTNPNISNNSTNTFLNLNLNHSPNIDNNNSISPNIMSQPRLSSFFTSFPSTAKKSSVCRVREERLLHDGFAGNYNDYNNNNNNNVKSNKIITETSVRLELGIGVFRGQDMEIGGRDLDLELRLGYSN